MILYQSKLSINHLVLVVGGWLVQQLTLHFFRKRNRDNRFRGIYRLCFESGPPRNVCSVTEEKSQAATF